MVVAEVVDIDRGVTMASHSHPRAQLSLVVRGSCQIETAQGTWTIPAGGGVWIPPTIEHAERFTPGTALVTARVAAGLAAHGPPASRTLRVSPLLRALVDRAGRNGALRAHVPEEARLAQVLVDEARTCEEALLHLAAPSDPRALRLARLLEDAPGDRSSLTELASRAGASRRTIERLFVSELGMPLGEWRQRLRLHHALRLLASERPVSAVAHDAGYGSATAFIAAFKRHFGVTPHQYRRPPAEVRLARS